MPAAPPATPPTPAGASHAPSVLSTLNDDGSRRWLRPRPSKGRFLRRRRAVAVLLIAVFTALPFVQVNHKPAVLLDLATRHFTFFGRTFLPTDTLLLSLLLIAVFVTVFWVTALLGRVWCGWACPQTVYLEFVFRPIERLLEGAPGRARRRGFVGSPPATALKYALYVVVSMGLAHTFLSYFVGVEELARWVRRSPLEHPSSFLVMSAVTGLMMIDFAWFREQVCIVACPYGRFQSAMLDRDSLIITYDRDRGEPRGKVRRDVSLPVLEDSARQATGDCVDCGLCVSTCPTGIDIRNGLQMECVGCAQCIDACDAVMRKIGRPPGLIRYSTASAMTHGRRRLLRPRVVAYPMVLILLAGAFVYVLSTKSVASVLVLRGLGAPFTTLPDGTVANPVRLKVVNRSDHPLEFRAGVEGLDGAVLQAEDMPFLVAPGAARTVPATIVAPVERFEHGAAGVIVRLWAGEAYSRQMRYRLMGPGRTSAIKEGTR